MLPISENKVTARERMDVRFKDETLRRALLGQEYLIIDGAMGSMLQSLGIETKGRIPDELCIESPETITGIHRQYVEAGAQVITTNTFGSNARKLAGALSVDELFDAAVLCAHNADAPYIAADIGPIGTMFKPLGDLDFDMAYELFAQQARAAQNAGCDLFIIETMADLLEMKAAVLAVKENTNLPIMATMTFNEDGHTLMGTTPQIAALTLDGAGVNALGANCSVGPDAFVPFIASMREHARCALIAQPNAGLPKVVDGETLYGIDVESFIAADAAIVEAGATVLGSCCGTTPIYTDAIRRLVDGKFPKTNNVSACPTVASSRQALALNAIDIASDAKALEKAGSDYSDSVYDAEDEGAPLLALDVDSIPMDDIASVVDDIQSMTAIPLWFTGDDCAHLEAAIRGYSGVPLVGMPGCDAKSELCALALHYGVAIAS